ncbi:MAG: matrixin family metalloprotease [Pseudomonadota bacterium]
MRVLLAMLLGSALLATGAARAAETEAGSADGVLRWSEEKFVWHYSRALPPAWLEPGAGLSLFRKAAEAWANCGVRIEFAGETDLPAGRLDGANVAGWSASMRRGMRGLTLRRQAALALLEADVVINGASQELRSSPELLRKVVLHEFGHALGLVHSPDCRDVMSFGAACRHVPASALPQQPAAGDMVQCTMRYDGALAR